MSDGGVRFNEIVYRSASCLFRVSYQAISLFLDLVLKRHAQSCTLWTLTDKQRWVYFSIFQSFVNPSEHSFEAVRARAAGLSIGLTAGLHEVR